MQRNSQTSPESAVASVTFRRPTALPGVEILQVRNATQPWEVFHTNYAMAVMRTWQGKVQYRGRTAAITPGSVFCSVPGEVHSTPVVGGAGSFDVLCVDPAPFEAQLLEHGFRRGQAEWRHIVAGLSATLLGEFKTFFDAAGVEPPEIELESRFVLLFRMLTRELIGSNTSGRVQAGVPRAHIERVRERLHADPAAQVRLDSLTEGTSMSRFQLIRGFKRCYGLPPHAYQLCLRVGQARRLLMSGYSIAGAAAELNFVDQSHFSRHFKRFVGITPAEYVRQCESRTQRSARLPSHFEAKTSFLSKMSGQSERSSR